MKGFYVISQWVAKTAQHDVEWRFYGDITPCWRAEADDLASSLHDKVKFCGNVSPEIIFSEIDILVHASVEFETFGMVLVEAARAGIPSVASAMGAGGEIVVDGSTGYLFDPLGDPSAGLESLIRLIQDRGLRSEMGTKARKRYETTFTADIMARSYASFWNGVINKPENKTL